MRGLQIWSQNWAWNIFDSCFGRTTVKIDQDRDFNDFVFFFTKIGLKYYPSSILWTNLNTLIKTKLLNPQIEIFFYLLPIVFSKFYFLCANEKAVFMEEKRYCFVIHIPWHRISSENLEKVKFGEKWNALQASRVTDHPEGCSVPAYGINDVYA